MARHGDQVPADFVWGVSTSAYQIEGAPTADGKGPSIWDVFVRIPGTIANSDTGDVACDSYHRWEEDLALLADLGVDAYRFSIAWTRVLPAGTSAVNQAGLDHYDRMVDALLAHNIRPVPTLFHWDLPQALQDRGGWTSRATAAAFAEYAEVVGERMGDRVTQWITHNEPWVATTMGHIEGRFAPGIADWETGLAAGHHILLSHGLAVAALRSVSGSEVGIALDCRPCRPASHLPEDVAAALHFDGFRNRWYFDPIFGKGYPADMMHAYRSAGRVHDDPPAWLRSGDLETIAAPIDFLGINYYTSLAIGAGHEESEEGAVPPGSDPPAGFSEMGWESTPQALTDFLVRIRDDYGPSAIYITENGASYSDGPDESGRIDDPRRIEYLDAHMTAVSDAIAAGVPVAGYFVWSLLDNFEWTSGYDQRFGLVWVDHRGDRRRIPKDSFHWYHSQITASIPAPNGANRTPRQA